MAAAPWSTQRRASSAVRISLMTRGRFVRPAQPLDALPRESPVGEAVVCQDLFPQVRYRVQVAPTQGGLVLVAHVPVFAPASRAADGEADRRVPGRLYARQEVLGDLVEDVVELEPDGPGRRGRDLLHRVAGPGRERHQRAHGAGRAGDRERSVGMGHPLSARRRREDREVDLSAEHGRGRVAAGRVHEHPGADADLVERLAVAPYRDLVARASRYPVPVVVGHAQLGHRFQVVQANRVHFAL